MAGEFASSFGAGLQSAESDRDFLLRKAQLDAQAPIRAAQVSLLGSQIQSANLKATMDAIAAQNAIKAQGSMAEALSFQGSLEGDYSPQNEAQFYNFVSKNPQLANTPWFTGMQKDFEVAKQLSSKADLMQQQMASREMIAADRAKTMAEIAAERDVTRKQIAEDRAATARELEKMRQEGKQSPTAASKEVTRRTAVASMVKEQGMTWAAAEREYDKTQAQKALPETEGSVKLNAFYEARKQNPKLTYAEFVGEAPAQAPATPVGKPKIVREFKLK